MIPSADTNTHYTIKKERGLPFEIPFIDTYAPLSHARKDVPPTLLVTGDRTLELSARYEENAHLDAILRALGNKEVKLYELQGFDHGNVYAPGCYLMLDWIKNTVKNNKSCFASYHPKEYLMQEILDYCAKGISVLSIAIIIMEQYEH